ncbi:SpaH/EbpB family LPXTG-anchored major pilin [Leucobacter sp.]
MRQQQRGRFGRRALAAIGVTALAVVGAITSASAASAVDEPVSPTVVGNIDTGQARSLTVHKYEEQGSTSPLNPDGSETPSGNALSGVEFTVAQVDGIDLTNPDDWAVVPSLQYSGGRVTDGVDTYSVTAVGTQETVSGSTTFSGLGIGVYLVTEGADNGGNSIVSKAEPFFVTVPLPHDNEWLYDVHVYPKNSVGSIEKSVDSSDAVKLGDVVKWTVTAAIPQLAPGESLASFGVSDTFDSRLGGLGVDSVTINDVDVAYSTAGSSGQTLLVTPDLATVNANQGEYVVIVFTSTVQSIGNGVIENQALVHLPGDVSLPSNKPATKWGAVTIEKYDAEEGAGQRLNGAKFALYQTQAEAEAALAGTVGTPVWTGETSGDGTATIDGLYVGDTTDGQTARDYYLVETQAPAGYQRHDAVIPVTVTPGSIAEATIVQVANTQVSPVQLPLTGSAGALVLSIAGLALLVAAAGTALIASRRKQATTR